MIGRKLNTRLAELKMQSKETMSKQQLQTLFEHECDKELERLGEISEAAKIFGRAGDVVDMELDLEAGWAYPWTCMPEDDRLSPLLPFSITLPGMLPRVSS